MHVAEVQLRRGVGRIQIDRRFEPARRFRVIRPLERLGAELVLQEAEDREMAGLRRRGIERRQLLARLVCLVPLVLFLVQLLEIRQRVLVVRIEAQDVVECRQRAVDEAAAL